MYIVYIDDSKESGWYVFSALVIKMEDWNDVFKKVKELRVYLKEQYGIYQKKELHASEFLGGRGRISNKVLNKDVRSKIYKEVLSKIAEIDSIKLFNALWDDEYNSFEALMNRINRTLDSKYIVICDEGSQRKITKLLRKMRVHNQIPSQFGVWGDSGEKTKNIPLDKLIEDPIFKDSKTSYFIQLVDFCAYSILRKEVENIQKNVLGIQDAFLALEPIFEKKACKYGKYGIIKKKVQDL